MGQSRSYHARAIVLDRTKLGEQDLIITLLSEQGEQLRAVARGARKPGGRLASRTDLFCESDFLLAHGRKLDTVSEAELVDPHVKLRFDLERMSAASVICELAKLTSYPESTDAFLAPLCSRALRACEEAHDQSQLDLVVAAYAFKVLAHEGWRPELGHCVSCGDEAVSYFCVSSGGVLCASCAKDVAGASELSCGQRAWLEAFIHATFDQLLQAQIDIQSSTELLSLAHSWAATQLETRLRAFEFMASV